MSLLLVVSFAPTGFSPVFPSPQKRTFPNSNSTRNQVDEKPHCGCATSKSLFIFYLLFNQTPDIFGKIPTQSPITPSLTRGPFHRWENRWQEHQLCRRVDRHFGKISLHNSLGTTRKLMFCKPNLFLFSFSHVCENLQKKSKPLRIQSPNCPITLHRFVTVKKLYSCPRVSWLWWPNTATFRGYLRW